MNAVASQRCLNHDTREAVARCPECRQFFCRECITEHDDRVICAACLRLLAQVAAPPRLGRVPNFWPVLQGASGFLFAWLIFYIIGRLLLAVPSDFHAGELWETSWFSNVGMEEE